MKSQQFFNLIDHFVQQADSSLQFSNRCHQIFDSLFLDFFSQKSLSTIIENYRANKAKITQKLDELLPCNLNSRTCQSLSNYFMRKMDVFFIKQDEECELQIIDEYSSIFFSLLEEESYDEDKKCYLIFKIEFLKRYLILYLEIIENNLNVDPQILNRIDKELQDKSLVPKHLRLFLMKYIWHKYPHLDIILEKYGSHQKVKCKWILMEMQSFGQLKHQFAEITYLEGEREATIWEIAQLEYSEDEKKIMDFIRANLSTSSQRYNTLTFFLNNFYKKPSKKLIQKHLYQLINEDQLLSTSENRLLQIILLTYLSSQSLQQLSKNEVTQLNNQMCCYNYLNTIIACQSLQTPLNDMLFIKNHPIYQDYNNHLSRKYLLTAFRHPAMIRIQYFLRMHAVGRIPSSYLVCSGGCDFMAPVGGSFYVANGGCQNPLGTIQCLFCGRQIGGAGQYGKILGSNQGSRIINPPYTIINEIQRISKKDKAVLIQSEKRIQLNLKGHKQLKTSEELKQSLKLKIQIQQTMSQFWQQKDPLICDKILQASIYFFWEFIIKSNIIQEKDIQDVFGIRGSDCQIFGNFSKYLLERVGKDIGIKGDETNFVSWHNGISKKLFNLLTTYKTITPPQESQSLQNSLTRDRFLQSFFSEIFTSCTNEVQKQKLIKENKKLRQTNFYRNLLQELFAPTKQIEKKYPFIYLIGNQDYYFEKYLKLKKEEKMAVQLEEEKLQEGNIKHFKEYAYCNLLARYQQLLQKNYPLLYKVLKNSVQSSDQMTEKIQLKYSKKIFLFVSQLQKHLHMKLKKFEIYKKSIQEIVDIVSKQIEDYEEKGMFAKKHISNFKTIWNNFADSSNFDMRFQCHQFKKLEKIDSLNEKAVKVIMDNSRSSNIYGNIMTSFVETCSKRYNRISKDLQNLAKEPKKPAQNKSPLNPTTLTQNNYTYEFPSKQDLEQLISKYCYFSNQNGVSGLNYCFEEIQKELFVDIARIQELVEQKDDFRYIGFIGEKSSVLAGMKFLDEDQETMEKSGHHKMVNKFFMELKITQKEQFYKILKQLQSSLQTLIFYYKNLKQKQSIKNKKIQFILDTYKLSVSKYLRQQTLKCLPLTVLVDFYEYIEYLSYENVQDLIPEIYRVEKLQEKEMLDLENCIEAMKRKEEEYPPFEQFKVALYRFVGRSVVDGGIGEGQIVEENLKYCDLYWNKNAEPEKFCEKFWNSLKIRLTKIYHLLQIIPYTEKPKREPKILQYIKDKNKKEPRGSSKKSKFDID